jgi:glucose/arabinose dehydrogenase
MLLRMHRPLIATLSTAVLVSLAIQPKQPLPLNQITLPPGFTIDFYATGVPHAREMVLGSKGTLFVGTRDHDKVYAIVDRNNDHKADQVYTIAEGLKDPSGVAFRNGSLYVAEVSRITRYDNIEATLEKPAAPAVVKSDLPTETHHGQKFIRFGPDGLLYVPVGAPCNVCERPDDPRFATILRLKPDGTETEIFASGVRNTVGFDWHPTTRELWFTDNGRDLLGDDIPPDELNHAPKKGLAFGFPYCHAGEVKDPEFGSKHACSEFQAPARKLDPHGAAIGMRFYTGTMFPAEYRNQIFIAEHGSWNRSVPIGYRVMLAKIEGNKVISFTPFAEGWLQGVANSQGTRTAGQTWGRPSDVFVMPDGALLVSDDFAGVIYRISYKK